MSEETPPQTDEAPNANESGASDAVREALSSNFVRYVNYVVLAALVLLALVAGVQLYAAVSRTINQWIVAEYRSLFHAAFNLAVLLIAGAGISWQIRRVTS